MRLALFMLCLVALPSCVGGDKTRCASNDDCLWGRVCSNGQCTAAGQATSDASISNAGVPDAAGPGDAGGEDASQPDSSQPPDASTPDAGEPDAGPDDAGPSDAGPGDAGAVDAARRDAANSLLDAAVVPCPCSGNTVCIQGQCLPGCTAASQCLGASSCDAEGTAFCLCQEGFSPCADSCCAIVTQTVARLAPDAGRDLGEGIQIAVDSVNHVHLLFLEADSQNGDTLWYGLHDGVDWALEVVQQSVSSLHGPALALDMLNNPHIAYGTWDVELRYARREADGLLHSYDVASSDAPLGIGNSIAVSGTPGVDLLVHIATGPLALMYYFGGPGGWQEEVIIGFSGQHPSLAVSSTGVPHVAFYDGAVGIDALKYGVRLGPDTWDVRVVQDGLPYSATPSLALNSQDLPRIAYLDSRTGSLALSLRYAPPDAGVLVWGTATLDEPVVGTAGFIPVLRLSRQDDPVIAYTYSTGAIASVRLLRLRNGSSAMWTVDRGMGPLGVGDYLWMDLDDEDRPVIAYRDIDRRMVVVAR